MIREMLEYCLTPASFQARRSGYLYEAIAFEARARRNEKYWRPHWKACQNLVTEFSEQHPEAESLAIFGSGCLFEVPKDKLAQKFQRIVLIDQVFPRSVRQWAKSQKIDIEMIETDLAKDFPKALKVDMVFSANLLSQLALANPNRKQEIEIQHLSNLKSLNAPSLLWTDTEKVFLKKNTSEVIHQMPTVLTSLPKPIETWNWNLALAPEWDAEVDVILRMQAIAF